MLHITCTYQPYTNKPNSIFKFCKYSLSEIIIYRMCIGTSFEEQIKVSMANNDDCVWYLQRNEIGKNI